MDVVYEIDLSMTNEVANNFSNTIASYVKDNCLLPAEEVYVKLSSDWSGSAAEQHLSRIYKLKDNYVMLNDCLINIGNEISKVVDIVAKKDAEAGGKLLPLTINIRPKYSNTGSKQTVVDENILTITDVSKNQIDVLIETINHINVVSSKIDTELGNLDSFWKTGSGKDKIIESIKDILNNLISFKIEAVLLINSLNKVKTTFLEEAAESSSSSGGGGGGGSSDTKDCPNCGFKVPKSMSFCPSCNKNI